MLKQRGGVWAGVRYGRGCGVGGTRKGRVCRRVCTPAHAHAFRHERTVVMLKQPGHFTSMKKELGDCTRRFSLCRRCSSSLGGCSRSTSPMEMKLMVKGEGGRRREPEKYMLYENHVKGVYSTSVNQNEIDKIVVACETQLLSYL